MSTLLTAVIFHATFWVNEWYWIKIHVTMLNYQLNLYLQTIKIHQFLKGTSLSLPGTSKIIHEATNARHDDAYIQLGFTCFDSSSCSPKPQCILLSYSSKSCYEIMPIKKTTRNKATWKCEKPKILLCAVDICEIMLGQNTSKKKLRIILCQTTQSATIYIWYSWIYQGTSDH